MHLPFAQPWVAGQAMAQSPQWVLSLFRSTHALPQIVRPGMQVLEHALAEQT
jgi:hypothetical protein